MNSQVDIIKTEFTKQAPKFNTYMANGSKEQFNKNAVERMHLSGTENVLEVAAGTCAFGRMIAPHVAHITELDVTEAMLAVGKAENEKANIMNADYVIGTAEQIPFSDDVFDVVVSRLAFHHFAKPEIVFAEMCRVLKANGQLVIADMIARMEPYRRSADEYETLRDPSHIRCLTIDELDALAEKFNMKVEHCSVVTIPMKLGAWMDLTDVLPDKRELITSAMQRDMNGGEKTGFEPYLVNGEIMFDHKWVLYMCRK